MTCIQPNLGSSEKLNGPRLSRPRAYPLSVLADMFHDDGGSGAQLGWLIVPIKRQVLVFRPNRAVELITGEEITGEGPVEGFVLDLGRVWCYQD
jgi:hypothetical protein